MARPASDPALREARGGFRKNPSRRPESMESTAPGTRKSASKPKSRRPFARIIQRYAEDVVAGRIVACQWVRLACRRHLEDRARESDRNYRYRFDEKAAAAFLARLERYPHTKGKWARNRELIRLEPWQCFTLGVSFGWKRKRDGMRRFREMYVEIPRKNTKSVMAALIGLDMLMEDGEHGAEVYCGAGSERQAHEVFGPAKLMLERSPSIRDEHGAEIWAKAIVLPSDNSRYWPIVGKPGDGASPSCAIVDEYHEHNTPELYDTMVSGMGAREQPMVVVITTAGTNLGSPCREKHLEATKVLQGTLDNDELFAIIYTIDEGDDWTSPEALKKANPNMGVSVDEGFLLAQQRQAIQSPASQIRFRTKHLNEWVAASAAGIDMAAWKRAGDPTLTLERLVGKPAVFSLDLASKIDICAFVQLFAQMLDGVRHYYAFGRYYLPEDTVAEARVNQQAYQKWVAEGHLIATPGAEIDFDQIREDVKDYRSRFQALEVVYDPWRAVQLAHQLQADGAKVVEMPQRAQTMSQAFDELGAALKAGRFHHDGNPVLEWMASNVVARAAMKGATVPSKEKPENKIDGVVAIIMAIARSMADPAPKVQHQSFVF